MKAHRRYHATFWGVLGLALLGIGLFNGLVDPLGQFQWMVVPGLNAVKPLEADHRRLIKAHAIRRLKPRGLILGSSRAEAGLDPEHPAWPTAARPVYNAAFPDANVYEMRRYFEHALAVSDVRCAVIGLDFFAFNAHFAPRADFSETRLAIDANGDRRAPPVEELLSLLFSGDALQMSWTTLRRQHAAPYLRANGQQVPRREPPTAYHGYRGLFLLSEQEYLRYKFFPEPARRFAFRTDPRTDPLAEFSRILALARQRGVLLQLFISPDHARLIEGIAQRGLWPEYTQWRRELVGILTREAERSGQAPFPLWDFNVGSPAIHEAVPPWDNTESKMTWFNDASHYTTNFGHAILDTLFLGRLHSEATAVRLDPQNVEAHLNQMGERRVRYAKEHPDDVREIAEIVDPRADNETNRRLSALFKKRL